MTTRRGKWWTIDFGDRMRARMQHTGKTPNGNWLWTPDEDQLCIAWYPDIAKLQKLLPRRTREAIRKRGGELSKARIYNCWTANEVRKLRGRWRDATQEQLVAEFPRHTWHSIRTKGSSFGVRRRPWRPKPTGNPILDEIRKRAAELRISLAELDRICAAGAYFEKSSQGYAPSRNVWPKAVAALGGRLQIVWQ